MLKKLLLAVSVFIMVASVLFGPACGLIRAQEDQLDSDKLNTVITNQNSIMQDLASIKEELRIIKVRITQSQ